MVVRQRRAIDDATLAQGSFAVNSMSGRSQAVADVNSRLGASSATCRSTGSRYSVGLHAHWKMASDWCPNEELLELVLQVDGA